MTTGPGRLATSTANANDTPSYDGPRSAATRWMSGPASRTGESRADKVFRADAERDVGLDAGVRVELGGRDADGDDVLQELLHGPRGALVLGIWFQIGHECKSSPPSSMTLDHAQVIQVEADPGIRRWAR